jgi:hypothetical protein
LRHEIAHVEEQIHKWKHVVKSGSNPELLSQERAIAVLTNENFLLESKLSEMIQREDATLHRHGNDNLKIARVQKVAQRLIATKLLCNRIG